MLSKILLVAVLVGGLLFFALRTGNAHFGPAYDTAPRNLLDQEGKKIAKQYGFTFLNGGLGTIAGSKGLWAVNFTCDKNMTIEQARPIATIISKRLLSLMYKDPLFAKYFEESNKETLQKEKMKDNDMAFKLSFWDKNVDRPLYPYLAQIRLVDGKLYYHYADPKTQALQDPTVESL